MKSSHPKRSTETFQWTERAKAAGLHKPGISIEYVRKLLQIQAEPLPVVFKVPGEKNARSPSPKTSIGPMIRNRLVRHDAEKGLYVVHWEGEIYINQLREAGLI
jgi:hypothetical protein